MQQYKTDTVPDITIHSQVLEIVRKTERIVQHYIFKGGYTEFEQFYSNKYNIPVTMEHNDAADISVLTEGEEASLAFSRAVGRTVITTDTNNSSSEYKLSTDNTRIIVHLLYQTFTKTWAAYKNEHDTRILNNMLTKYSNTVLTSTSTNEAAAILNNEPSVDPKLLKDIISSEVSKATKDLKKQINTLKQSAIRTPKNSTRGEPKKNTSTNQKTRASPKKSQQSSSTTVQRNRNNNKQKTTHKSTKTTVAVTSKKKKSPIQSTGGSTKRAVPAVVNERGTHVDKQKSNNKKNRKNPSMKNNSTHN